MAGDFEQYQAPSATTSNPPPRARVRRRGRQQNEGPPQLQFVTATDPLQFKDEKAKRSVRSQAMIQYRYQSSEQKRKLEGVHVPSGGKAVMLGKAPAKNGRTPILLNDNVPRGPEQALLSQWLEEPSQATYNTTAEAWWSTNANADILARERGVSPAWCSKTDATRFASTSKMPTSELVRPSRYRRTLAILPKSFYGKRVTSYQNTEAHDAELLDIFIATIKSSEKLHVVGSGMDPFSAIPQFKHPELNSVFLVRRCNRVFSSRATLVKWLPVMLAEPHILLSSTSMASTWLDMHAGICGESKRTVLLKQETIGYINERLRDSRAMDDSTLAVILHCLSGEMWSSNEKTMRIHQAGVARLIALRGGMSQLNVLMAQVAAGVTYHGNLICEDSPLPLFHQWAAPPFTVNETMAVPESPLYCPRGEFFSVIQDNGCSESTHDLICDMRDLTDLFVAHNTAFGAVVELEADAHDAPRGPSLLEYDAKLMEIRGRVASLPSARIPGLSTTNDWIYEACRIAAIIYASAIIMHVPLSAAADPCQNIIMRDIASPTDSCGNAQISTPRLTETLYEIMEMTNTGDMWNNMSGVWYWVTTVGAAAARTPVNIDTYSRPSSANEAYATWVRRCLIMFATRSMCVLLFDQPLPLIMSEKRLLKVQELLRSGSGRTVCSDAARSDGRDFQQAN